MNHLLSREILGFWEILKNHLTGIQSRRAAHVVFVLFLGSKDGTAWRHESISQAMLGGQPNFWVFDKLPGGDEHPPGDANQFLVRFFMFWVFWDDSNRGKRLF